MFLFIDPVLIGIDKSALEVGVEVGKEILDLIQLLLLRLDLLFNIDGAFCGGLIPPHFFYHLIGVDSNIHHPLDTVQHTVVQPLVADRMRRAGGAALAVGRAFVVDVGFVGIVVDLLDQRMAAVGTLEQSGEEVDTPAFYGSLNAPMEHPLHAVEVVFFDDRVMGALNDDPLVGRTTADTLCFVVDFLTFALHHVADIHLVLQGAADCLIAP